MSMSRSFSMEANLDHWAERLRQRLDLPLLVRWKGGAGLKLGQFDMPRVTLDARDAKGIAALLNPSLDNLGEAYVEGHLDVTGSAPDVIEIAHRLAASGSADDDKPGWMGRIARGIADAASHTKAQDRAAIEYHYDVSNDFYAEWLDPRMLYSCAYFENGDETLAEAQTKKLDHILTKARVQPGDRLLDIGCGWGALALWAARHYGVEVHGITLSEQQCGHARERIAREGCADRVHVELRDYRDLPHDARYDRIVSVGMFEHIGVKNFPVYFGAVQRRLAPGGLFLNHGITNDSGWVNCPSQRFINRYVFPDGELTRVSAVQAAMEQAGFEILDVEGLRPHYAMTLRHWLQALDASRERAEAVAGAIVRRIWRLYMAGSAHYFSEGGLGVYQILAGHRHARQPLPLRRADLYRA